MTNWKFHAIALGTITLMIVIVFSLTYKPKPTATDPNTPTSDRFIQIHSASYGLNCNARLKYRRPANGAVEEMMVNNVLLDVSRMCNGKVSCNIDVRDTSFSKKFPAGCAKELEVEYRCFSWDRPWKVLGVPYELAVIDCANQ